MTPRLLPLLGLALTLGQAWPLRATDYLEPKTLTGSIYADAELKQLLFNFRRTATGTGSTVRVLREYTLPNGTLAARERVVYEAGRLTQYQFEELQSGARGQAAVRTSGAASQPQMVFEY